MRQDAPTRTVMRPTRRAIARALDDKLVVLDTESGSYFELDTVGARIWQLIAEGSTVDQVVSTLTSEFTVEPAKALRDASAFFDELRKHRLIEDD
jgi:hypothetical protein